MIIASSCAGFIFSSCLSVIAGASSLKSIGCFIKKPIAAEQLIKRISAELE
jgi:hypothetical protein